MRHAPIEEERQEESLAGLMAAHNQQTEENIAMSVRSQPTAVSSAPNSSEVSELSTMVKALLSEQRELKDQLSKQTEQL